MTSENQSLTREALNKFYAEKIRSRYAPRKVAVEADRLEIETADGSQLTLYTENLWKQCCNSSGSWQDVLQRYVDSVASVFQPHKAPAEEDLVAIIKDSEYFAINPVKDPVVSDHLAGDI
jgi:hypothetical protein